MAEPPAPRCSRSVHHFCRIAQALHAPETAFATVLSSNITPVYAKQNLYAHKLRALLSASALLGGAFLAATPFVRGAALDDAPHELAMKVCTAGHKQAVNVHWRETGESLGYWSDARKKSFLDQISACGIDPTQNPDAPVMRVSAEVTPSRFLLIAESSDTVNGRQIRMVEVPRVSPLGPRDNATSPHLTGELLWQQERPVSSAMEWQDPVSQERFLFLLSDGSFARLHFENGSWHPVDTADLPSPRARSRTGDGAFAYQLTGKPLEFLHGGKVCAFQPNGALSFSCAAENLTEKPLLLSSACEAMPRYLTTGSGDYAQPDQILLGSMAADTTKPAPAKDSNSSAVDVPGPVLGISLAEKDAAAFAVVRNLSTGNYEVYRITAVCGN